MKELTAVTERPDRPLRIAIIGAGPAGVYTAEDYSGLEALACYWHATDIIWLVIFPFFYVLV